MCGKMVIHNVQSRLICFYYMIWITEWRSEIAIQDDCKRWREAETLTHTHMERVGLWVSADAIAKWNMGEQSLFDICVADLYIYFISICAIKLSFKLLPFGEGFPTSFVEWVQQRLCVVVIFIRIFFHLVNDLQSPISQWHRFKHMVFHPCALKFSI